jgi:putative ABC transport system ATP-binding protein
LADEPTGNLDTRTSIEIMGLLQAQNDAGLTVLMVTHELDIAAYCKRIVVMRDGAIIRDERNTARRFASAERAALDAAEQQASLG